MVSWVKVALLSLGLVMCASALANAETPPTHYNTTKFEFPTEGKANADLHGATLPPIGYVDFCARGEQECQFSGGKSGPLMLNTVSGDKSSDSDLVGYITSRFFCRTLDARPGALGYVTCA